ncbi:2-keto-4-pentenoate hydratase [Nonomuraea sp. NPDC050536]|uniref:2-keto-4-pentenoate hydratase n=1 Tax=Nonomuraea sp. NPDC050536 TaxID=3364366 RepID=UPI0037CC58BF
MTDLAARLDEACRTGVAIPQPVDDFEPYEVQSELIGLRLDRGERLVGVKLGFTSEGKRRQMGVNDLILGRLTDAMSVHSGPRRYIHPRVEPEVVYLTGRRIASVADAVHPDAVAAVAPGLEIIDSRYENFRFSLESVIADNTSAAGYAIGPWRPYDPARWNLGVVMEIDGRAVQIGSTGAILGDPRRAVVEAARLAAAIGLVIEAGSVLLAGAATPAEPLRPGAHVRVEIQDLGEAAFRMEA